MFNDAQRTMSELQVLIYVTVNFLRGDHFARSTSTSTYIIQAQRDAHTFGQPSTLIKHLLMLLGSNKDKCLSLHTH